MLSEQLSSFIEANFSAYDIPGLAVGVIQDGEIVLARGFGVRDAWDNPVTPETLFRIGSTQKSITALCIASLVDNGVLDWDTRAIDIYPDFKLADERLTQSIRIRDMLNMGAGLMPTSFIFRSAETIARQLFYTLRDVPAIARPGERFIEHNDLFSAGALIAAMATGVPLEESLDAYQMMVYDHVLMPLGMNNATFVTDIAMLCDNAAQSFEFNPVTRQLEPVSYTDIGALVPSGGLAASVNDMLNYLRMLLAPERHQIVSAENLYETMKPDVQMTEDIYYGMGWSTMPVDGVTATWHNGGLDGFASDIALIPEMNAGIVVLSNASPGSIFNQAVLRAFVTLLKGGTPDDTAYRTASAQMRIAGVELSDVTPYLGDYEHYFSIRQQDDGTLWLHTWGNARPLLPVGAGEFVFAMHTAFNRLTLSPELRYHSLQQGEPMHGAYKKLR